MRTHFASVALEVVESLGQQRRFATAVDRDAEWQRVNSYIADVLKDTHVLYAKLARLQGDFVGRELSELEKVSEAILDLGKELSQFSKAFYEGHLNMADSNMAYGTPGEGQPPAPAPAPAPPADAAPPADVPVVVEEEEEAAPAPEAQEE